MHYFMQNSANKKWQFTEDQYWWSLVLKKNQPVVNESKPKLKKNVNKFNEPEGEYMTLR